MIRRVKLVIEYDGSALCGWQRQQNGPTVQGHLERCLAEVVGHPVTVVGASRTDPAMFDGIDWGSERVLEQQRRNLSALGLSVADMPALWDVDRPGDLARLKALKPPLDFFWPPA